MTLPKLISRPVQHDPRTAWTWTLSFSMVRHGSEIFISILLTYKIRNDSCCTVRKTNTFLLVY